MSSSYRRALAIAGAVVMISALSACATKKADGNGAIGQVGVSPTPSDGATGGIDGGTDGATDGTDGSPTPTDTATVIVTKTPTHTPTPATTVTVTAQPTITIDSFKVTQTPRCPTGPEVPIFIPGQDITISWQVSGNVTAVGLSIDDPNFYKSNNGQGTYRSDYTRNDSETLSWGCDPGHTQGLFTVHTYTLSTIGGGKSVAKTITVKTLTDP